MTDDQPTPSEDAEQNGAGVDIPPPPAAWQIVLRQWVTNYVHHEDGSVAVHITPAMIGPAGVSLTNPQIVLVFDAQGWENFKRQVAAGGRASRIVVPPPGTRLPGQ